MTFRKG